MRTMTKRTDITGTIWVEHIAFKDDPDFAEHLVGPFAKWEEYVDGVVHYEAEYTRPTTGDEDGDEVSFTTEYYQLFQEGEHEKVRGRNVWGWDGDKENPTLSPSFGHGQIEDGWYVHLFLKNGEIQPCADMALEAE